MDNLEQQIEARLNELSDDELNKLAIHLKFPRAHEGIQAPLRVKISDLQRMNFVKWVKGTGNIQKAGIYLGIIPDSKLPTIEKEVKSTQKLEHTQINRGKREQHERQEIEKAPELVQNIAWVKKHWREYWKLLLIAGFILVVVFFLTKITVFRTEEPDNAPAQQQHAQASGDFSPAIVASPGSQVKIYYGPTVKDDEKANEPKYEFYYQPLKGKPDNPDGSKNYEIGFKNLTTDPLVNFEFGLLFLHPVQNITYDFDRSSANFIGGEGLNRDKTKFHWMGNQIMGNGGWVVFIIKTKNPPNITKLSTRLVGKLMDSNKLIPSDPEGLKQFSESF